MTYEWLFGIIAALFGGTTIFEFIFIRAQKQKFEAAAKAAAAEAEKKEIELVKMLKAQLAEALEESFQAQNLRQEENNKHFEEITGLKKEIASLRGIIDAQNIKIDKLTALVEGKSEDTAAPAPKKTRKTTKKEA